MAPEGVEFVGVERLQAQVACKRESFEGAESSIEFVDAAFEGVVGRDAGFSSEVDEGEEEVADFVGQVAVVLGFCECIADFVDFFLEFVDDVGGGGPVEAQGCGVARNGESPLRDVRANANIASHVLCLGLRVVWVIEHEDGLTCLYDDIAPEVAFGIDEVSATDGEGDGDVDVLFVEHGDEEAGAAAHGGVGGVGTESRAVDGVVGIGGATADDVARIDVFEVESDAIAFGEFDEFVFEEDADVVEHFVARGIDGF